MNDPDRKGILATVAELKFIASLVVNKNVFGLTSRLSELLQNDSVNILSAITVTKATKQAFKTTAPGMYYGLRSWRCTTKYNSLQVRRCTTKYNSVQVLQ